MKTAFKAIFEGLRTEGYCGYSGWKGSTEGSYPDVAKRYFNLRYEDYL